jgi:hypothetical protein
MPRRRSSSINFKFGSDRRGQASAQHLFDALLGKPPTPTCETCGGVVPEPGAENTLSSALCNCEPPRCKVCEGVHIEGTNGCPQ